MADDLAGAEAGVGGVWFGAADSAAGVGAGTSVVGVGSTAAAAFDFVAAGAAPAVGCVSAVADVAVAGDEAAVGAVTAVAIDAADAVAVSGAAVGGAFAQNLTAANSVLLAELDSGVSSLYVHGGAAARQRVAASADARADAARAVHRRKQRHPSIRGHGRPGARLATYFLLPAHACTGPSVARRLRGSSFFRVSV